MINGIGTVDYLKLINRTDYDEGGRWLRRMEEEFLAEVERHADVRGGYSVRVTPPMKDDPQQRRGYVFECWGNQAAVFAIHYGMFIPAEQISRIDYREEVAATREGIDVLGDEVSARRTHWNVTRYNKRPAQKTASRDSGGYGVGIGSRKSERSMVAYKRGREAGAVEVRFTGATAKALWQGAKDRVIARAGNDNVSPYAFGGALDTDLMLAAASFVSEATGLTTAEFADMISFDPSTMPEVKQAMIERDLLEAWEAADEAVQMSFLNSILLRANGGKR